MEQQDRLQVLAATPAPSCRKQVGANKRDPKSHISIGKAVSTGKLLTLLNGDHGSISSQTKAESSKEKT